MAIHKKTILTLTSALALSAVLMVFAASCAGGGPSAKTTAVGHSGGPMLGSLYYAAQAQDWPDTFSDVRLGTSADVAYALLSGDIQSGFVDSSKIIAFEQLEGFQNLTAVGKITFPYGATLVLRKGLNLRLSELEGLTVAVSAPECLLLQAFEEDALRLGVDTSALRYETIPFDAMLPALEAGTVDAAVLKGSYAALAQHEGHTVLYQNWELQPGDECCPAVIEQTQYVLLAHKDSHEATVLLPQRLLEAQQADEGLLRRLTAEATGISLAALEGLPNATFSLAEPHLIETLVGHSHEDGEHDHDDHDD